MPRTPRKAVAMTLLTLLLSTFALIGPLSSTAQAYPTYCKTKRPDRNTEITTCIHITKIYGKKFNVGFEDGVLNPDKGRAKLNCTATQSKTMKYSVSASVKAEAGAIFAKASVEVSGGLEHSSTTGYSTSVSKWVPGHKNLVCKRGMYSYKFKGTVTKTVCSNANCSTGTRSFKGKAPQSPRWLLHIEG